MAVDGHAPLKSAYLELRSILCWGQSQSNDNGTLSTLSIASQDGGGLLFNQQDSNLPLSE